MTNPTFRIDETADDWRTAFELNTPQTGYLNDLGDVDWFHVGALTPGAPAGVSVLPDLVRVQHDDRTAALVGVPPNTPILNLETLIFSELYQVVEWTGNYQAFNITDPIDVVSVAARTQLEDTIASASTPITNGPITFDRFTNIIQAESSVTVTDLNGNTATQTFKNDYYVKVTGQPLPNTFVSTSGVQPTFTENAGRYLVVQGQGPNYEGGQRSAAWGPAEVWNQLIDFIQDDAGNSAPPPPSIVDPTDPNAVFGIDDALGPIQADDPVFGDLNKALLDPKKGALLGIREIASAIDFIGETTNTEIFTKFVPSLEKGAPSVVKLATAIEKASDAIALYNSGKLGAGDASLKFAVDLGVALFSGTTGSMVGAGFTGWLAGGTLPVLGISAPGVLAIGLGVVGGIAVGALVEETVGGSVRNLVGQWRPDIWPDPTASAQPILGPSSLVASQKAQIDIPQDASTQGRWVFNIDTGQITGLDTIDDQTWFATAQALGVTLPPGYQRTPTSGFDETAYRLANPDVDLAIRSGSVDSGWDHWTASGRDEGRFDHVAGKTFVDTNSSNFAGTALDEFITASAVQDNTIDGGGGDDVINGGYGSDTIMGGAGDDLILGSPGFDRLDGGDGNDTVDYSGATHDMIIDLTNVNVTHSRFIFGLGNPGEAAQNGTLATAQNIDQDFVVRADPNISASTLPNWPHVTISGTGDDTTFDYYSFTVGETGGANAVFDIDFGWSPSITPTGNINAFLRLYDADGNELASNDDRFDVDRGSTPTQGSNVTLDPTIAYSFSKPGTYTIRVGQSVGSGLNMDTILTTGTTYQLHVSVENHVARNEIGFQNIFNIENAVGGSFDDLIIGDGSANRLDGGGGNDELTGGGGADVLIGSGGIDTAVYSTASARVDARLIIGRGFAGDADGDTYSGIENLTGSGFGDILVGHNGNNVLVGNGGDDKLNGQDGDDTLVGGDGNDFLNGGAGADVLDGSIGTDAISYLNAKARVDARLINGGGIAGDASGDTYISVENLFGSRFNDFLAGDNGRNVLAGSGGNDSIHGLGGDDTLVGGDGNDVLTGGAGADVLDGADGTDTANYSTAKAKVDARLINRRGFAGDADGDIYVAVENLSGSAFNDILVGDNRVNTLNGRSGNDVLNGHGGNDVLIGGGGNDFLIGHLGDDVLTGGAGNDIFLFRSGDGEDKVTDFAAGPGQGDRIFVDNGTNAPNDFAGIQSAATQIGADTVIDLGGGDTITLVGVNVGTLVADDFMF